MAIVDAWDFLSKITFTQQRIKPRSVDILKSNYKIIKLNLRPKGQS